MIKCDGQRNQDPVKTETEHVWDCFDRVLAALVMDESAKGIFFSKYNSHIFPSLNLVIYFLFPHNATVTVPFSAIVSQKGPNGRNCICSVPKMAGEMGRSDGRTVGPDDIYGTILI